MYDELRTVSDSPVLVEAELRLFSKGDGGRHTPITKNYRPNHNFFWPENGRFFIGQVELEDDEWVHPGEKRLVNITFLDAVGLRELLTLGRIWKIQEGSIVVGEAEIKYVVANT